MQVPKPQHKRKTPKRGQRGAVKKEQAELALDWFGDTCNSCNGYPVELHHIVFKSKGGRGGFRNLMPLCKACHTKAHRDRGFADSLRQERAEAFGEFYYMDADDLCYHGLIDEPSDVLFEKFMKTQEEMK